jgi:hypothetical protein
VGSIPTTSTNLTLLLISRVFPFALVPQVDTIATIIACRETPRAAAHWITRAKRAAFGVLGKPSRHRKFVHKE